MGSRMPSRAGSRASLRKSLGGRPGRQASCAGASVDVDDLEENGEGDDDVGNGMFTWTCICLP